MSTSRPIVATFEPALTILWNVATCTAPQHELTAHLHTIEWSAKVFYQAAGEFCSEFAPSGLIDAAHGLFIALQRGTVNMLYFFCTTAKIVYCSQHRIITKLCVTFSPYQIHFLKDHINDCVSDLRDVQKARLPRVVPANAHPQDGAEPIGCSWYGCPQGLLPDGQEDIGWGALVPIRVSSTPRSSG
jgi:hypothetical protein